MARPLRIEVGGGLYHVTLRVDQQEAVFRDDRDRRDSLTLLGAVCDRCNWRCHADCAMTNHYHCGVETPDNNLSYATVSRAVRWLEANERDMRDCKT